MLYGHRLMVMLFPPTNWTQLREATLNGQGAGREALEAMCRDYRTTVVAFLRQRGYDAHEAEDLTQHLFLELLEKQAWRRADQSKGRFRTFLLGVLMYVMSRERRRAAAGCPSGWVPTGLW